MRLNWFAKSSSRRSAAGRALRTVGHSWSASPLRRLAQAAAFVLFLVLFFYVAWPYGSGGFAEIRSRKEIIDIESFLALDPLVGLSAAIADRAWVWSLPFAGVILAISLLVPRIFCGYLCPMGTTIDLFDWAVSNRIKRFRVGRPGWWRNLRYYVLVGVLTAAVAGVMLSGFVAAIPVVTRGFQFIASPLQTGATLGWSQVPPLHAGHFVSIGLFALVLGLGLLRPRFWCCHVCPTGAIFSLVNRFRLTERKVSSDCIQCGQCLHVCSFDAINDDFTTLGANCAFCQTCGGVCPVGAIDFGGRVAAAPAAHPQERSRALCGPARSPDFSRRGFMIGVAVGAVTGGLAATGVRTSRASQAGLLRSPARQRAGGPLQPVVRAVRAMPAGVPEQPAAAGGRRPGDRPALDAVGQHRLGGVRADVQQLRPGLPDRRDPGPHTRREEEVADGTGRDLTRACAASARAAMTAKSPAAMATPP